VDHQPSIRRFFYLPRNAWVLTSTSAVWSIGAATANPYQTLYFSALGAQPFTVGLLIAYGTGITVLSLLVGGYVADTWGRRRVIVVFSWVSVASALMFALVNSYYLLVVPLTLASVSNMYGPAFNSLMMDEIEPSDRIRGFSVFNAVNTTPSIFAPTIGGLLMGRLGVLDGLKIAFLASALFGVIGVSLRMKWLEETYLVAPPKTQSLLAHLRGSLTSGVGAARRSNQTVKKLLLYVTLAGIGTGLASPFVSIYAVNYLRISPVDYSIVVDFTGLATVALMLAVVVLIQRIGARRSVLVASAAAPVSNIIFSQAKTTGGLMEWGVTGSIATALQTPSLASMQAETIPPADRGRILSMFSLLPALVSLPSQVAAGYLYSGVSPVAPFLASVVPFAVAAMILYSAREVRVESANGASAEAGNHTR
jgi:MFS transporter, DHA1 family, tetracycline resistance protein